MKYYLIAGEASGDLHGSNLMKELKVLDPDAGFRFFGGDLMQQEGGTLVTHYREMAFMGIIAVLRNLKSIRNHLDHCKKDLLDFRPDVLILIDYPGFNLRMAEFAHKNGIRVFWYISPKLWAWKEHRVKKIRAFVDEIFTIFPFETAFYRKHGIEVHYSGNPLLDSIEAFRHQPEKSEVFPDKYLSDDRPVVALLAGSRVQEVKSALPLMIRIALTYPGFQFVVAGVRSVPQDLYDRFLEGTPVDLLFDQTYNLLAHAHTALVISGTASLETALFGVPQTVIYKMEGGLILDVVVRNFILKSRWVSLPNIIMNKEIIREFIQKDMTYSKVKKEMDRLLFDQDYRNRIRLEYLQLREQMGETGSSARAARKMAELLTQKRKKNVQHI